MNLANRPVSVSVAVFILRLVWGVLFIIHGMNKFLDMNRAVASFVRVGMPQPGLTAPAIALLEVVGGAVLILGFSWITRILALLLAAEMVGAIAKVKYHAGLLGAGGFEFEVTLLTGLVVVALIGPGMLAVIRERAYVPREAIRAAP